MKYVLIVIGVLHVALGTIYSVLASIVRMIVRDTGGEVFIIWRFTPIILVFSILPMVWLLPIKSNSIERGFILIILDLFYILGGLTAFVYYANNILNSMGRV